MYVDMYVYTYVRSWSMVQDDGPVVCRHIHTCGRIDGWADEHNRQLDRSDF